MIDWDTYFMSLVYFVSMKSKDESTHIGVVVVDKDNRIRSTGYNSFPAGVNDNVKERQERPLKYYWMSHAEMNAIASAAKMGISLDGCTMYTNGIPCTMCARMIINSGIKKVIIHCSWNEYNEEKWTEEAEITEEMFYESGVELLFWEGDILKTKSHRRGEDFLEKINAYN